MKKTKSPGIRKTGITRTKEILADGRTIKTTQASAGRSKVTKTKVIEPVAGGVKKSVATTVTKPMNQRGRAAVDYFESQDWHPSYLPVWKRGKSAYMTTRSKSKTKTKVKSKSKGRSSSIY